MKHFTHLLSMALVALAMWVTPSQMWAQSQSDETASTNRWKGADVETLTTDSVFYLYNVGTGRFMIAGGEWGTQAMLLYQDFGAAFNFQESNSKKYINSGATNAEISGGHFVGINYPDYTTGGTWTSSNNNSFGVILEAQISNSDYSRELTFTRVETSGDVYTYYISEKITNKSSQTKTFYIGALKGVDTSTGSDDQTLDASKVAYTETEATKTDNKYYQWRFVTKGELQSVTRAENANNYGGLNANISYLISDPYFDRNRNDEFKKWNAENGETTSSTLGNTYRYNWFGSSSDNLTEDRSGQTTTERPWDAAVVRKVAFNTIDNGQYAYGLLDGIGTVSQTLTGLTEGWYKVECRGLAQGNTAKLYATSGSNSETATFTTASGLTKAYNATETDNIPDASSLRYNNNNTATQTETKQIASATADYDKLLEIGKTLNGGNQYVTSVSVYVSQDGSLTFGVEKDAATKSAAIATKSTRSRTVTRSWSWSWYSYSYGEWSEWSEASPAYYYDTDIVAFDNFNLYYLGKEKPFLLDEDKTDESYLDNEFNQKDDDGNAKNKNVTTYLHRTFTVGKWNSLVLPVSMSSAQVKQYFGEGTKIAKLHGLSTNHSAENGGHASQNSHCIDFKTIDLTQELDNAIMPGQMYIINPAKAGSETYKVTAKSGDDNVQSEEVTGCYLIGRHDFSGKKPEPTATYGTSTESPNGKVQFKGTYVKLEADAEDGTTMGSYVFSGGDMYHLKSSKQIKGFRGWLNDVEEQETGEGKGISFSLDGNNDGNTTYIDGVSVRKDKTGNVYNINGQLVRANSSSLEGLAKGIYIVGGKKMIVK